MEEPRTHYQISLTARQAVGAFVGLLLSLGLAFFFGLMTGLAGRPKALPEAARTPAPAAEEVAEAMPPAETAVPPASSRGETSRRESTSGAAADATPPATLQTFEDGSAEEAAAMPRTTPAAPAGASRLPPAAAKAPGGRIWVQVASLSTPGEAHAVSDRLSRRGYRTQVVPDKGRLRVRVGPYRTTEEARRAADRLRKQERVQNPWVVSEAK